jgi:hypothetical protein
MNPGRWVFTSKGILHVSKECWTPPTFQHGILTPNSPVWRFLHNRCGVACYSWTIPNVFSKTHYFTSSARIILCRWKLKWNTELIMLVNECSKGPRRRGPGNPCRKLCAQSGLDPRFHSVRHGDRRRREGLKRSRHLRAPPLPPCDHRWSDFGIPLSRKDAAVDTSAKLLHCLNTRQGIGIWCACSSLMSVLLRGLS